MIRSVTIAAFVLVATVSLLGTVTSSKAAAASGSRSAVTASGTGTVEFRGDIEVDVSARFPVLLVQIGRASCRARV